MQKLGEKLAEAGIVAHPKRTTFEDGFMSTTEAYLYYKSKVQDRGMSFISKMMFKWHLKHGQYLKAQMRPNPFGKYPSRIYAIDPDEIIEFVEELVKREDTLTLQRQGSVIRRTTTERVKSSTKSKPTEAVVDPTPEPETVHSQPETPPIPPKKVAPPAPPPAPPPGSADDPMMNATQAFKYLCKKATHKGDSLNKTLFGFYLAYELIDSVFVGKSRQVEQSSLDAFLELCPTGLYKKHIDYVVKPKLASDDLDMKAAYAHYCSIDPNPVTISTFRSLTAAGIIVAIRAENTSNSKTLGYTSAEVEFFGRMRVRIAKKNANIPSTKGYQTKKLNGTQRKDAKKAPIKEPVVEAVEAAEEATGREWVKVRDAYHYYVERVDQPMSEKWFAKKCYTNDPFESRCDVVDGPSNLTGKRYMVNLDSVDAFLQSNKETKPNQKSYPLDKAYHKFRGNMPAGLSLIQFKRLVRNNILKSFIRDGVARVRQGDVIAYFQGQVEVTKEEPLAVADGYDYYCSKASDPVAKNHFLRWVYSGTINGSKESGSWTTTMRHVDDFLSECPTGRTRSNKNSRVASGALEKPEVVPEPLDVPEPTETKSKSATITVSMSKFATPQELSAALQTLTDQGFKVQIEP
jgi:hypothetical protein